jgi:hypothetical protein
MSKNKKENKRIEKYLGDSVLQDVLSSNDINYFDKLLNSSINESTKLNASAKNNNNNNKLPYKVGSQKPTSTASNSPFLTKIEQFPNQNQNKTACNPQKICEIQYTMNYNKLNQQYYQNFNPNFNNNQISHSRSGFMMNYDNGYNLRTNCQWPYLTSNLCFPQQNSVNYPYNFTNTYYNMPISNTIKEDRRNNGIQFQQNNYINFQTMNYPNVMLSLNRQDYNKGFMTHNFQTHKMDQNTIKSSLNNTNKKYKKETDEVEKSNSLENNNISDTLSLSLILNSSILYNQDSINDSQSLNNTSRSIELVKKTKGKVSFIDESSSIEPSFKNKKLMHCYDYIKQASKLGNKKCNQRLTDETNLVKIALAELILNLETFMKTRGISTLFGKFISILSNSQIEEIWTKIISLNLVYNLSIHEYSSRLIQILIFEAKDNQSLMKQLIHSYESHIESLSVNKIGRFVIQKFILSIKGDEFRRMGIILQNSFEHIALNRYGVDVIKAYILIVGMSNEKSKVDFINFIEGFVPRLLNNEYGILILVKIFNTFGIISCMKIVSYIKSKLSKYAAIKTSSRIFHFFLNLENEEVSIKVIYIII